MDEKKARLYIQLKNGSWLFCREVEPHECTPEELKKLSKRMDGRKVKVEK